MLSLFESDIISATDIFNLLVTNCLLPGQTFHVTVGNAAIWQGFYFSILFCRDTIMTTIWLKKWFKLFCLSFIKCSSDSYVKPTANKTSLKIGQKIHKNAICQACNTKLKCWYELRHVVLGTAELYRTVSCQTLLSINIFAFMSKREIYTSDFDIYS